MLKISILLLCLWASASSADFGTYVDSGDNLDIEKVAQLVCKTNHGTKHLIGKASTINKLVDFFMEVESDHKLFDCRKKYMGPLAQLAHVVDSFSDDVCAEDKLNLIETYHRKYISRVRKHLREQKRGGRAPEMAKLFFMQYATEVSSICEQAALKTIAQNKHTFSSEDAAKVESLRRFTDSLGMTDLSDGYNGIYLFWNMVDALDMAHDSKFSDFLAADAPIRINVQMRDGLPIKSVQALCKYQLKPSYSKSLLPVLRLIDMGYYPHGRELANKFTSDPATRSLFFSTQICETVLPIQVFSDEQLDKDQFVALSKEDASNLEPTQLQKDLEEKLIKNTPLVNAELSSLKAEELKFGATSIDTVKSNVGLRSKVINRLLKNLMEHVKEKLKSMFSGFKLFHRGQDKKLQPFNEEPTSEAIEIKEEEEERKVSRRKRGSIWKTIATIPMGVLLEIYAFLLIFIKIIFLSIPSIVLIAFGDHDTEKLVKRMWTFGDPTKEGWYDYWCFPQDR